MSAGTRCGSDRPWRVRPPVAQSNEAEPGQLHTAPQQEDAYGRALQAAAEEDGAAVARAPFLHRYRLNARRRRGP